ncbi:tRNA(Arg) A34 adenosine deaminase TadA [Salinibacter ruber]|uniref:nucleoside deaminase n=1 Tax=Salinibacter ruber TaxID=146919 RepID=UPI002167226B|nr:nucleoside deaminase [Salinibacter ruber]MCS3649535.1 tRNA(Arg) A34 adenosine deaminase TadA [Salinibacter ruber]MCS3652789.1 tRNA(Arg) A34 adenosine deaminase TadA [Salinibacter ruber]
MPDSVDALDHERFVRAAIDEAASAQDAGNPPFGAVLVGPGGTVLDRAGNTEGHTGDCTGHAETNLVRAASQEYEPERLAKATLYASTEPCAMCAGAIFWARIGRVVFGLRAERLYDMKGDAGRQLALSCEDVLARGNHEVEVVGPVLEDEAAAVFDIS